MCVREMEGREHMCSGGGREGRARDAGRVQGRQGGREGRRGQGWLPGGVVEGEETFKS